MTPAEQPMPPRLYVMVLLRILKWFTIMALRLGVGLNSEQLTTRMSICRSKQADVKGRGSRSRCRSAPVSYAADLVDAETLA